MAIGCLTEEMTAKTPARRGVEPWASGGGRFCEDLLRARAKGPSYLLDFSLGCRCQAVGNWGLPGGVMLATHPPAGWRPDKSGTPPGIAQGESGERKADEAAIGRVSRPGRSGSQRTATALAATLRSTRCC